MHSYTMDFARSTSGAAMSLPPMAHECLSHSFEKEMFS